MDPYGMKNIVVPNLFYNTTFGALEYIDTINLEAYELLGNWSFSKTTTYHQNLYDHHG
jgi:GH18 family chitinase